MQGGNVYGLIITALSLAVTVIMAMRQIDGNGIRVEFVIQPGYSVPSQPAKLQPKSGLEQDKEPKIALKADRLTR